MTQFHSFLWLSNIPLSNIFRIQNIILVGDGGSIEIETKRGGGEVSMMGGI